MDGAIIWIVLLGASALVGFVCSRILKGFMGAFCAGAVPWFGLLAYLLLAEYVLPYRGGG